MISVIDNKFETVFSIESALGQLQPDVERSDWAWKHESEVLTIDQAGQDWYEIKVITTGTKPRSNSQTGLSGIEEVNDTSRYVWEGEKYKLRGGNK